MEKNEIIKKAQQYGLRTEWINNNTLHIYSGIIDEWFLEENKEDNKLILKHKNLKGGKIQQKHEHIQKIYNCINEISYIEALKKIKNHDRYIIVKNEKNKMARLYDLIKTGNIPRVKIY